MNIKGIMKKANEIKSTSGQVDLVLRMMESGLISADVVKNMIIKNIGEGVKKAVKKDGEKATAETVYKSLIEEGNFMKLCDKIELSENELKTAIESHFEVA